MHLMFKFNNGTTEEKRKEILPEIEKLPGVIKMFPVFPEETSYEVLKNVFCIETNKHNIDILEKVIGKMKCIEYAERSAFKKALGD